MNYLDYPTDGGLDERGHRWCLCWCGARVPVVRSWSPRLTQVRTVRYYTGWHRLGGNDFQPGPVALRVDPRRDSRHWGGPVSWLTGTERLDRCEACPLAGWLRREIPAQRDLDTGVLLDVSLLGGARPVPVQLGLWAT